MNDPATLKRLSETARELANELFRRDVLDCTGPTDNGPVTCIRAEEDRPLTRAEKAKGWSHRGFASYDTSRMCRGCEAYYHAERAAQNLHEAYCWAVRIEADAARKATA
jgi:hypothetical protein